jgi:hypothetical protein
VLQIHMNEFAKLRYKANWNIEHQTMIDWS